MTDSVSKPKTNPAKTLVVAGIILVLILGTWFVGISAGIISFIPINTMLPNFTAITLWTVNPPDEGGVVTPLPDFETTIIATGIVDVVTNEFVETALFNKNDRGAVQFKIVNVGNIDSPEWQFNVTLPTFPFYIYLSEMYQPLNPKEERVFTLFFDQVIGTPEGTIEINADPTGVIAEMNEINNIARAIIIVTE